MAESKDYLEMTFKSINCFADDGKLDAEELGKIFDIAMRDGELDANERRVLNNIINRVRPEELDGPLLEKMDEIKNQFWE
ncbi:hypothetical protein [Teredinibacter sp. KSP-S5-2]|uniref:hypothetical protein n=1 Tax=Teredinibacter sp. KSP-S5-2 TaxID=3034506 RepID=UPI0029341A6C|nr:hypothetical protein [Teredinibacter sp. KSP-S5-2]WNO09069.1 hypothetical protein P5V12_19175 [Teredinibacter sp. KSP-S5-2]